MISADFIKFSTNANHWPVNEIYSKLIKNKLILREREGSIRAHIPRGERGQTDGRVKENKESWKWSFS